MREATKEELHNYKMYLRNHIDLVSTLGKKAFNLDFSNHDFDKMHAEGDKTNLLALRNAWHNGSYHPSEDMIKRFDELVFEHVKVSKHHPEYYSQDIRFDDFKNGECDKPVDCSQMSKEAFLEMVSDWASVAIKRNTPLFAWYNDKCCGDNPRFIFTDKQHNDFIKAMNKVHDIIEKYHIHYPGIEYTAEQVEPMQEKIIKKGNKWQVTDHTGTKNLGTYDTKADAEKRLKQVEYFKHLNEEHKDFLKRYILINESRCAMTFNFKTDYDANLFRREIPYVWTYVDCSKPRIVNIYWDSHNDMQDFMNQMNNNTKKLIVSNEILKEEVSSGTFSSMTPETCVCIVNPVKNDEIKNT